MFRRLFRFLLVSLVWMLSLTALLFVVIVIYHQVSSLDPDTFLGAQNLLVYTGDSLKGHPPSQFSATAETSGHITPLNSFKNKIGKIFRRQPVLLRKFMPVFSSSFRFSICKNAQPIMIFDLGWKSFLFSASSFVVRTTWSADPAIQFSTKEHFLGQENITIYSVSLSSKKAGIHIALKKNILLLATSEKALLQAIAAQISGKNLLRDSAYAKSAQRMGEQQGYLRIRGVPGWLHRLLPFPLNPKKAWTSLNFSGQNLRGRAVPLASKEPSSSPTSRILHSNTYQADPFPFLRAARQWKGRALLFDALEEILKPQKKMQWRETGNETGHFLLPEGGLVYFLLLHRKAAARLVADDTGKTRPKMGEVYAIKSSPLLQSVARLSGINPPRFMAYRGRAILAARSRVVLHRFLDTTARNKQTLSNVGRANILDADPAKKRLLKIRHDDGTIRFQRLPLFPPATRRVR